MSSMVCVEEVKMEFLRKCTEARNILATCLQSLHDIKLQYKKSIFMLMSVYWGMRHVCGMHPLLHNTTEEKGSSAADDKDFVVCMNDRKLFTCRSRWVKLHRPAFFNQFLGIYLFVQCLDIFLALIIHLGPSISAFSL